MLFLVVKWFFSYKTLIQHYSQWLEESMGSRSRNKIKCQHNSRKEKEEAQETGVEIKRCVSGPRARRVYSPRNSGTVPSPGTICPDPEVFSWASILLSALSLPRISLAKPPNMAHWIECIAESAMGASLYLFPEGHSLPQNPIPQHLRFI